MSNLPELHYDAFISYRHNEFDSFVAENLHKKLENFKLPKSVIPKVKSGKTKIERVFRDVDELPLSDDLSDPISRALKNSDFLITICTPRYPQSRWCMKEIEVFLQTHPRNHILVVLAEDEPVNSFPEILCYDETRTVDENGKTVIVRREIEPLAADTRGENKKEILKAMDTAVIKLCAAIFGLNYDDLRQRHREQRLRRMAMIFGSIGAALLAFAIFATAMLIKISRQNVTITEQYNELQNSFATTMASASGHLYENGRRKDAAYAVRSVISDPEDGNYNASAMKALYNAMGVYKVSAAYTPVCSYDAGAWLDNYYVSYDKKYVLAYDRSAVYVYDTETAEVVKRIDVFESYVSVDLCGSGGVLISDGEETVWHSISSDDSHVLSIPPDALFYPASDGKVTLAYTDGTMFGLNDAGEVMFETNLGQYCDQDHPVISGVSFEGGRALIRSWDLETVHILIMDEDDGSILYEYHESTIQDPVASMSGDVLYIAINRESGEESYYDEVSAIDLPTMKVLWKQEVSDISHNNDEMILTDGAIFLSGEFNYSYDMVVMNRENGEILHRNSYTYPVMTGWPVGQGVNFILKDGSVFYCDDITPNESRSSFFTASPGTDIAYAEYIDGDLFVLFDRASYVTRYSDEVSRYAVQVEEEEWEDSAENEFADDALFEREEFGVNEALLDTAFYSGDGKYIYAIFTDHTAKIYDAETAECVTEIDEADASFSDLRYSDVTGSYILDGERSYILDNDMRIICVTDRIIRDDGDGFVIQGSAIDNDNPDSGYYRIPFIGPGKLLDAADEYLSGYTPSDDVRDRYGLR